MSQERDNGNEPGTLLIEDPTLRNGVVVLPKYFLFARNVSAEAKLLYAVLLGYAFDKGNCFPGLERLCADMQMTANTLRKKMAELVELGILKVKRRGLGKTNVYIIADLRNAKIEHLEAQELSPGNADVAHPVAQGLRGKNQIREVEEVEEKEEEVDSNPPQLDHFEGRPIEAYLRSVAAELHDEAPFKSTLKRLLNLYADCDLSSGEFVDLMGEAKRKTQRYSPSIKKQSSGGGGLPTKNKMPYWFSVLEDLLGLKEG